LPGTTLTPAPRNLIAPPGAPGNPVPTDVLYILRPAQTARMVRQRVLYGSLMMVALVALMLADAWLSRASATPTPAALDVLAFGGLTTLGFALITLAGAVELCRLCRQAGHRPAVAWCLVMVVLAMIGPWMASVHGAAALDRASPGLGGLVGLERVLPWLAILGTAVVLVWRQRTDGATADFATTLLVMFTWGI